MIKIQLSRSISQAVNRLITEQCMSDWNPLHYKKMTSTINLEGKTLSSTIAKLNAPLTQAFDPRLSSESPIAIIPTPTYNTQAQRLADFETLTAALEYAAAGSRGI